MRTALLATAALATMVVPALADPALPGDRMKIGTTMYGCAWDQYDKLGRFVSAGDRAAFGRYLSGQVAAGACTAFAAGEVVTIEKMSLWHGASEVRRVGDITSWWVTSSILDAQTKIGGPR